MSMKFRSQLQNKSIEKNAYKNVAWWLATILFGSQYINLISYKNAGYN